MSGNGFDITRGLDTRVSVDSTLQKDLDDILRFMYIRQNIPQRGEEIGEFLEQLPGCQCSGLSICSSNVQCSCVAQFGIAYESDQSGKGRRLVAKYFEQGNNVGQPVMECNIYCFCQQTCFNRCVQLGIVFELQIFRTPNKGLGVRTLGDIEKRNFVCEYAGEVLTFAEAKRRSLSNKSSLWYLFALREHVIGGEILCTYVDPTYCGNVGRFINHSCQPNLLMVPVRINNLVPHLAFFALRDILPGEELTYDYSGMNVVVQQMSATTEYGTGAESLCVDSSVPLSQHIQPILASNTDSVNGTVHLSAALEQPDLCCAETVIAQLKYPRTLCLCGEPVCKKYLPFDGSLFDV